MDTSDLQMLPAVTSTECFVNRTIPIEFATYLISSDINMCQSKLFNYSLSSREKRTKKINGHISSDLSFDENVKNDVARTFKPLLVTSNNNKDEKAFSLYSSGVQSSSETTNLKQIARSNNDNNEQGSFTGTFLASSPIKTLKPIIVSCKDDIDKEDSSATCSSETQSTNLMSSQTKKKKKVSFADQNGFDLESIKIMTEPSNVPPLLRQEMLAAIDEEISGVTKQAPLKLNFLQPASDYKAFIDRVELHCVSLETVILKHYNVLGTVKVKNVSFEKQVFLRFTVDSWKSYNDVVATYLRHQENSSHTAYDTFSFTFDVPPYFDSNSIIEFAVNYVASNRQYWDNNYGKNYQIISTLKHNVTLKSTPPEVPTYFFDLRNTTDRTSFACWNRVDTNNPYW